MDVIKSGNSLYDLFQSTHLPLFYVNLRKCHIIGCQYLVREVHDLHLTGLYAVRAADPV